MGLMHSRPAAADGTPGQLILSASQAASQRCQSRHFRSSQRSRGCVCSAGAAPTRRRTEIAAGPSHSISDEHLQRAQAATERRHSSTLRATSTVVGWMADPPARGTWRRWRRTWPRSCPATPSRSGPAAGAPSPPSPGGCSTEVTNAGACTLAGTGHDDRARGTAHGNAASAV